MQIRCSTCTKTIAIAPTGALPPVCPHCRQPAVPERLGAFVLDRLIAAGGMGEVYLAHHDELGTEVAIKLLPAMPLDVLPGVRRRFAREARLTAKVTHPGVVRVLHSDVAGDRPFLVLEFVTGQTLRQHLAGGPLPVVEAARLCAAVADVLAKAHEQGVLHRDIKPDNIMVQGDGSVRVLDFGIARAVAEEAPLTRTGEIVGTPEYMAPEQLLDGPEATDARTDVHALGVMLYELLTGRSPFRGANVFQALKLVESLTPPPPSRERPQVPPALDAVVARAMHKQPERRHPDASTLAAAVRSAVPELLRPLAADGSRTEPRTWWLAAAIVFAGIAMPLAAWQITSTRTSDGRAPDQDLTVDASQLAANERAQRRAAIRDDLLQGRWTRALASAVQALDAGDRHVLPLARDAFVLGRAAWPLAAGLPAWLAGSDVGLRQRLFGDLLEPRDDTITQHLQLLAGDEATWQQWLAEHGADCPTAVQLLQLRLIAPESRAAACGDFARLLPIDAPEHWLARTIERHLEGDPHAAGQAAEMAWLAGAGELAVLLDAGLALLPRSPAQPPGTRQRALPAELAARIWRRVSAGDHAEHPAGQLLQLAIACHHDVAPNFDPSPARDFPAPWRQAAGDWFVAAAEHAPTNAQLPLLRVAVHLGAEPDFTTAPWRSIVAPDARRQLEREARRGQ